MGEDVGQAPYVVIRTFKTRTGKFRALAAGPFPNRWTADTFKRRAQQEDWHIGSQYYLAPLRPAVSSDLLMFQEA
jgi:hypothetical protein